MPYGAETPFILLARCKVKADQLEAYLAMAQIADGGVNQTEPGMLHHTFDQDPNDAHTFVWSEVYANDAALLFHLDNPPLLDFVEKHLQLGDGLAIEVYGTLAQETKDKFDEVGKAVGFEVTYFDTKFGFSRVGKNE